MRSLLYEGKAKKIWSTDDPQQVVQEYKDSLTAFNGEKKEEMKGKGTLNAQIASLTFEYLNSQGVLTHFIKKISEREQLILKLEMFPLEVVVRNVLAGSLAKRLGMSEGQELSQPILDLHYKDDALGDPFLSEQHAIVVLKCVTREQLDQIKTITLKVNQHLKEFFLKANLKLVDFKLEFGRDKNGKIYLGDEVSPDTCRLWDIETLEKRDKDRFRRNLGNVLENYELILKDLKQAWEKHI